MNVVTMGHDDARRHAPPLLGATSSARARALSPLTLACLRLASPHASLSDWRDRLELLCEGYGERTIRARMQELLHNGYITIGLSTTGFLTHKGRAAMREQVA